jgi:multidrug efflux pump subunit AcrB
MKLSHFFIDHPRFATVINIFIVGFGLAAAAFLPVAQYPNIVPPTVQITTAYPGASAETIARTVATPLEQAINGVENMDYISSQSTSNGLLTITVIFKIGTDINTGLMLTHKSFPPGLDYINIYDPTSFVSQSIHEVTVTVGIAIILVIGVVYLFLQSWRATMIPVVAIPVSLVGAFSILAALGTSINNLSLFGLVLAVGIVVDDAIVVVENVERNMRLGIAERGGTPHDGRGIRSTDRHRPDPLRRLPPVRLHLRHLGPVLHSVRDHHRRVDGDLVLRLANSKPGPLRGAAEAAPRPC